MASRSDVLAFLEYERRDGRNRNEAIAATFRAIHDGELEYLSAADVAAAAAEVYDEGNQTESVRADEVQTMPETPTGNEQDAPALRLPCFGSVQATQPPDRAPVLVSGLLRLGHTALLVARAKSGKSWSAIALCVAVASGGSWLGHQVRQGKCLFIDPELDPRSLSFRFRAVADAMGVSPATVDENVYRWTLRGVVTSGEQAPTIADVRHDLDALVDSGRLARDFFSLIVIDSCSALLRGDENASTDIRGFFNAVLGISKTTGASIVCVHHEGKAASGDRDAIERGRGSSAWADCPDLVLSLVETFPPSGEASDYLTEGERAFLLETAAIREFPPVAPQRLVWSYPAFRLDAEGVTEDWKPQSSQRKAGQAGAGTRKAKAEARADQCAMALLSYFYAHDVNDAEGIPATEAAAICSEYLGEHVKAQTLKQYVTDSEWLDVWQRSSQRWAVVPRHLRQQARLPD